MKKILIVGASYEQFPIIKRAKDKGYYTIVADKNEQSYGFLYADEAHTISTRDLDGIYKLAKEKSVDAITYMITETPMESIYFSTTRLGLPGPSYASTVITQSKYEMRKRFDGVGIVNPKYVFVENLNEMKELTNTLAYPFIIKPIDKGGQVGLHKIENEQVLHNAIAQLYEEGIIENFIVEEFMEGEEINVVATVIDGKVIDFIASDRIKHEHEAFGVVLRHLYPCTNITVIKDKIKEVCEKIVQAMEIENGIIFPQLINNNGELKVVEVGERIPGGVMKEVFEFATGIDLLEFQLDIAFGTVRKDLISYKKNNKYDAVTVKFLTAYPGRLETGVLNAIHGLSEASRLPGIVDIDFFQDPRRRQINSLRKGADRYFYIIAVGGSREEVIKRSNDADKLIKIETK